MSYPTTGLAVKKNTDAEQQGVGLSNTDSVHTI